MVILAIGVLALQQLGVGAIRLVAQAGRNTAAATTATTYLEDGLQQVRQGALPQGCTNKLLPDGTVISRTVDSEPITGDPTVNATGTRVTIKASVVAPHSTSPAYVASASAFSPTNPLANGRACP